MKISVVLVSYNGAEKIPSLLKALALLNYPRKQWQLLLVDNNSSDTTQEKFLLFKNSYPAIDCTVLVEQSQGKSFASNMALQVAKYDHVLFIDDDMSIQSDFIQLYAKSFQEHPDACILGGGVKVNLTSQHDLGEVIFPYFEWMLGAVAERTEGQTLHQEQIVSAGNMALHRVCDSSLQYNTVFGRMYDRAYLRADDYEICLRAQYQGLQVVFDPALTVHTQVEDRRLGWMWFMKRSILTGIEAAQIDDQFHDVAQHRKYSAWSEMITSIEWTYSQASSLKHVSQIWLMWCLKLIGYFFFKHTFFEQSTLGKYARRILQHA